MCRWWIQSFSSVTEEPQRWKGTSVLFASHMPLTCAQVINVQKRPDSNISTLFFCHSIWTSNFPWGYWHWQTCSCTQLCGLDNSWDATRLLRLVTGMHNAHRPASTGQTSSYRSYEREMRNCKPDMSVTVSADLNPRMSCHSPTSFCISKNISLPTVVHLSM